MGIYGISVDSVFCHGAFAEHMGGLPFDLLADFERKMVEAYGVRRDDVPGYAGFAKRSVFIVDHDGVVRWIWERSDAQPMPDVARVVEEARAIAAAG